MADQLPTGLTPDDSSFQAIGTSSGSGSSPQPTGLTGDDSTFQPIQSGSSSSSDASQPQSFQTPGGSTFQVGQSVQHSGGTHGEVTGQHPDTGNAMIKWHQGADQFKQGMLVRVDGHSGVVTGKTNNGKVLVDWGNKGITSVSPGDIEAPGGLGSFVAGVGSSLAKTVAGGEKILGQHSAGLDESQNQIDQSTAANPASGKAGELAGDLIQFLSLNGAVKAGTGALTALEVPEQYRAAATITKALADHPVLAKILHAGINGALTGGTLGGIQSGGSLGSAAEGAAIGGLSEAGAEAIPFKAIASKTGNALLHPLDTASNVASSAVDAGRSLIDKATTAAGNLAEKVVPGSFPAELPQAGVDAAEQAATSAESEAARAGGPEALEQHPGMQEANELRDTADQHLQSAQSNATPESWRGSEQPLSPQEARQAAQENVIEPFHGKIREAISDVAQKAGVNFEPGKSIQDTAHNAADAILNKSKQYYAQVDEAIHSATGRPGRFQAHDEEIRKIQEKLSDAIGDKELQTKLGQSLAEAQAARNSTWNVIKSNNLEEIAQKASDMHKLGSALEDLSDKIRVNTNGKVGSILDPERVNPNTFQTALRNLKNNTKFGDSRLGQALGDSSDKILQATSDAKVGLRQLKESAMQRVSAATQAQKLAEDALKGRQEAATQTYKQLSAQADAAEAQAKLAQGAKQFELKQAAEVARSKANDAAKAYSDVLQQRASFKKKAAIGLLGSAGAGASFDLGHHIAKIFTGE